MSLALEAAAAASRPLRRSSARLANVGVSSRFSAPSCSFFFLALGLLLWV